MTPFIPSPHKSPLRSPLALAALVSLSLFAALAAPPAAAQVAGGSTTVGTTESTQTAMGWSVKKTLLGKNIYNEAGKKVGRIEDLIISPDRSVSYVIVGAGGFIGLGRHDVAVPVSQIQDRAGKLVMPGATPDLIKAMPVFHYADSRDNNRAGRTQLVDAAERDITRGRVRIVELEKRAEAAGTEGRAKVDLQISALRLDLKSAEDKLGELKQATAERWRDFEAGVNAATTRLRKSIDLPIG